MALVFGDSFDHYALADILKKWSSVNSMANSAISADYALAPHSMGLLLAGNNGSYYDKTLGTTLETFIAGTWFRTGITSTASVIMSFLDGATEHVSVRYDATGKITFTRNGTVLATSANALSINTWYHVETKVTIGDAADSPSGAYEVRVDGTSTGWIASATGADTRNAGNKSISNVRIHTRGVNDASTANHRYQDYYILSTSGSTANDFLGPCRFQVMRPIGSGTTAEWTGSYTDNWQNVADQVPDSDTTFNQSNVTGTTDQFSMSNVPSGTIHAIQHVIVARKDAGAARQIRPVTRISGTDYNGTTVSLSASYAFITEPVSVSPATSNAWTDTEVNALEGGYELVT